MPDATQPTHSDSPELIYVCSRRYRAFSLTITSLLWVWVLVAGYAWLTGQGNWQSFLSAFWVMFEKRRFLWRTLDGLSLSQSIRPTEKTILGHLTMPLPISFISLQTFGWPSEPLRADIERYAPHVWTVLHLHPAMAEIEGLNLGYAYPHDLHERVHAYVERIRQLRPPAP